MFDRDSPVVLFCRARSASRNKLEGFDLMALKALLDIVIGARLG